MSGRPHLVNTPIDDESTTLLHLAANTSTLGILQLLLQQEAVVNWQNDEGTGPLHVAAMWGNGATLKLLLEYGADPFITDSDAMTPLDYAQSQGNYHCDYSNLTSDYNPTRYNGQCYAM